MSGASNGTEPKKVPAKKEAKDFKFGKVIGEGSFSTVSLRDIANIFVIKN